MKTKLRILLLLPFFLFSAICLSGQPEKGDKTLSPYFFIKSDDPGLDQLPLKSTRVRVSITGVIAAVHVEQVYQNDGSRPIEAVYVFPASTRAAVHAMKMTIGERTVEAKIREREQARRDYEQAKHQGQGASLLEQQRPNVFQMNVANIMPGDLVRVGLDYTELLVPEHSIYEFVYPTVVGPRYANQPEVLASKDDRWVANPYTTQGTKPFYTFDIACSLQAGMPVSDLRSVSHEVTVNFAGADEARVTLKDPVSFQGNRDFILQYRLSGNRVAPGMLLYEGQDENFFLAMIQPPQAVKTKMIPPREYVFIVDVSGSMHGFPLEVSKKLMNDLFSGLCPEDRFNILTFAGGSAVFSESSVAATADNVNKARRFISGLQGGGGTELLPALQRALNLGSSEDMSRTFIIATDGYVTVEKEAFDLVRSNLGVANLFAFGIGSSVNRYIIEGLARAGMGLPFVVTRGEEAEKTAGDFLEYVQRPVLTDISVTYDGLDVYDVEPAAIPDVFAERPVIIFGKWRKKTGQASVRLTGVTGEGNYLKEVPLASAETGAENAALRYLWARERIRNLDDFGTAPGRPDGAAVEEEVTRLGLKYNLLTRFTSFVAIDSEVRNKEGQATTVTQPLPLPEGASNYAVGGTNLSTSAAQTKSTRVHSLQPGTVELMECADESGVPVKKVTGLNGKAAEDPVSSQLEQQPEFPGGEKAMREYLRKNLRYPSSAKLAGITGTVYVSFTVGPDGRVTNVKIRKGIGGGCDEEALRLIRSMPSWKPARQQGRAVKAEVTVPVRF